MTKKIVKRTDANNETLYFYTHSDAVDVGEGSSTKSLTEVIDDTLHKSAQTLTNAEKTQVYANLGTESFVGDRAVRYDEAQVLGSSEKTQALTNLGLNGVDEEPTAGSGNLVKSGGVQNELALGAVYDVSAKNPTAGLNNDGKFESLSALLSDANLNTLIPIAIRKGGMSIKFVQSSDNKYVQYRLMADDWSTTVTDWQGVDDEPTLFSKNLITSGGVKAKIDAIGITEAETEHDFAIGDENGNNIIVFEDGDFETKNFNSRTIRENLRTISEKVFPQINQFSNITGSTFHHYYFPFKSGYTVSIKLENISGNEARIGFAFRRNGEDNVNYQLKMFDASEISTNLTYKVTASANYDSFAIWYERGTISLIENFYVYGSEIETNIKLGDSAFDLSISDANENRIALFKDGHFRTKKFNSKNRFSNFSILGDSYSTFKEFTTPTSNAQWYPTNVTGTQGYNSGNDVTELEQTWWYKFANEYGIRLLENNSYSGSPICYDGYGTGTSDAKTYSFVTRGQNLSQNPELILVFGGTNDSWANSGIGSYKYSDWTEEDLVTFRPALAKLLYDLRRNHIGSTVIFILNNGLKSEINSSIDTICKHYGVSVLKLQSISKVSNHPDSTGMEQIKEQLIQFLLKF